MDSPCLQCRAYPVSLVHNRALDNVLNMIRDTIKTDGRDIENLNYQRIQPMEEDHDKQYRDDRHIFNKRMKGLPKMIDRMSNVLNYARSVRTITAKELIEGEIRAYTDSQGKDYGKNAAILFDSPEAEEKKALKYFGVGAGQFLKDNILANIPEFSQEVICVAFVASKRPVCVCKGKSCGCGHDTYVNLCKGCRDSAKKWCQDFQDVKKLGPGEFLRKEKVDTLPHAPSGSPDKFDKGQVQFLKYCCYIHVLEQAICLDRRDFPELSHILSILRQYGAVGKTPFVLESFRYMASEGLEIGTVVVDDDEDDLVHLPEIHLPKRKRPVRRAQLDTT